MRRTQCCVLLLLDERVSHRDSFAKNAAAFFKMSRSSRRPAFSRRRRQTSSSSDLPSWRDGLGLLGRAILLSPDLQKMWMDVALSGDLRQWTFSIRYSADRIVCELLTEGAALLSHYTSPSVLRRRYRCVRETGQSSTCQQLGRSKSNSCLSSEKRPMPCFRFLGATLLQRGLYPRHQLCSRSRSVGSGERI